MAEQHLCQRHGRPRFEVEDGAATELLREGKEEKTLEPTGSPA